MTGKPKPVKLYPLKPKEALIVRIPLKAENATGNFYRDIAIPRCYQETI